MRNSAAEYTLLSSDNKALFPHFIIIGAMKSGTTALYRYCSSHPAIEMSRDKETDFFVTQKNWDRGFEWYGAQFKCAEAVRGEASPSYSKSRDFAGVAERIAQSLPNVRLIYIVREPIERAEAQYRHGVIHGVLPDDREMKPGHQEYEHILDTSRYGRQLSAYLEYFPAKSILVLDFGDLVSKPQMVMDQVFAHIGVAPHMIEAIGAVNKSTELSRVPAPILTLAQSPFGKFVARLIGRDTRDTFRRLLARGRERKAKPFPDEIKVGLRKELSEDMTAFRKMTGMKFHNWSV